MRTNRRRKIAEFFGVMFPGAATLKTAEFFGMVFPGAATGALVIGDGSSGFLQGRLQSGNGVGTSLRAS